MTVTAMPRIAAQPTAADINLFDHEDCWRFHDEFIVLDSQTAHQVGLDVAHSFAASNGADEVVIDPQDFGPSRFSEHTDKVIRTIRHRKCSLKAKNKPRNIKLAEAAAATARQADNGGGIKHKKKLPKRLIRRLYAGEVLSTYVVQKYDLTIGQNNKQEQNKQRVAKVKQSKKIALAIA